MSPNLRFKSLFFFYFATVGVYFPYFPNYLASIGIAPWQIGALMGLWPFFNIFVPPLWGFLSDRHRADALLLKIAGWGSVLLFLPFFWVERFAGLIPVVIAFGLMRSPIPPLMNAAAFAQAEGGRGGYGSLRVWGSVGFIVSNTAMGYAWEAWGARWILYAFLFWAVIHALSTTALRGSGAAPEPLSWSRALRLLRIPGVALVVAVGMPHWMCQMAFGAFFNLHLTAAGMPESLTGWMWSLGAASEIAVIYWGHRLVDRWGVRRSLRICLGVSGLRWALVALQPTVGWIAFSQTLHSLSFGLFYMASVLEIERIVPPNLRASGQALFASLVMALGGFLGLLAAGAVVDRAGTAVLFGAMALANLLPAAFLGGPPRPRLASPER